MERTWARGRCTPTLLAAGARRPPCRNKAPKRAGAGVVGGGGGAVPSQGRWYSSGGAESSCGAELWAGQARGRALASGRLRPRLWPGAFPTQAPPLCPHSGSPSFLLAAGCQETTLPRQSAETGGGGGGAVLVAGEMVLLHCGAECPGGGAMGESVCAAAHWPRGRPRPHLWPGRSPRRPRLYVRNNSTLPFPHASPAITTLPQAHASGFLRCPSRLLLKS